MEQAKLSDLSSIMKIVEVVVTAMNESGNTQWDQNYPIEDDFKSDIQNGNLYIIRDHLEIVCFVCLDSNEPEEYKGLPWSNNNASLVIHRMAVNPKYLKKGYSTIMLDFASKLAKQTGFDIVKADTYSINEAMNKILINNEFAFVDQICFLNKPHHFNCYEKCIK